MSLYNGDEKKKKNFSVLKKRQTYFSTGSLGLCHMFDSFK